MAQEIEAELSERIRKEFPKDSYSAAELSRRLGLTRKRVANALEKIAIKGHKIFTFNSSEGTDQYVLKGSIIPVIAYLQEGIRIKNKKYELERVIVEEDYPNNEGYGNTQELLKRFIPIRNKINELEERIGLSYEELQEVKSVMKRRNLKELRFKEKLTLKEITAQISQLSSLHENYVLFQNQLIDTNKRWIMTQAQEQLKQNFELRDLYHVAIEGFIRSLKSFDPNRGVKLITYAKLWIKSSVGRFVHQHGRMVRLPYNLIAENYKISNLSDEIRIKEGRKLTSKDVKKRIGKVPRDWESTLQIFHASRHASLDADSNVEGTTTFRDLFEQETFANQEEELASTDLFTKLIKSANLDSREHAILRMRFGFEEDEEMKLQAIGNIYDVSRERIRQIESEALNKLRDVARKEGLMPQTL